jgi:erythromycin esterase-like protein
LFAESIAAKAIRFDRVDADFPFLADLTKGKRVIGVGEETHGTSEFTTLEWNLVRQLAGLGFRDIALELSSDQLVPLEAFLNGDPTVSAEAAALPFIIRGSVETAKALSWLREFNAGKKPDDRIRLWPVDILDVSVEANFLKGAFKGAGLELERSADVLVDFASKSLYAMQPGQHVTEADARRAQSAIGILGVAISEAKPGEPLADVKVRMAIGAVECQVEFTLATIRSGIDINDPSLGMVNANITDRAMAEAIAMLVKDGRKVVFLAHNAHIQKGGMIPNGGPIKLETSAGIMLSSVMEKDYLSIGLKTGRGTVTAGRWDMTGGLQSVKLDVPLVGSCEEAMLSASGGSPMFVDLRDMAAAGFVFPERMVGGCHEPGDLRSMALSVPGKSYDAVFFVPETKASVLLKRPPRNSR